MVLWDWPDPGVVADEWNEAALRSEEMVSADRRLAGLIRVGGLDVPSGGPRGHAWKEWARAHLVYLEGALPWVGDSTRFAEGQHAHSPGERRPSDPNDCRSIQVLEEAYAALLDALAVRLGELRALWSTEIGAAEHMAEVMEEVMEEVAEVMEEAAAPEEEAASPEEVGEEERWPEGGEEEAACAEEGEEEAAWAEEGEEGEAWPEGGEEEAAEGQRRVFFFVGRESEEEAASPEEVGEEERWPEPALLCAGSGLATQTPWSALPGEDNKARWTRLLYGKEGEAMPEGGEEEAAWPGEEGEEEEAWPEEGEEEPAEEGGRSKRGKKRRRGCRGAKKGVRPPRAREGWRLVEEGEGGRAWKKPRPPPGPTA